MRLSAVPNDERGQRVVVRQNRSFDLARLFYSRRHGIESDTPFIPTDEYFAERKKQLSDISYDEVWNMIHRGSMPELCENPDFDWQMFYAAYVRTYIERDVRDLTEIGDVVKFTKFMTATAASTGQLVNLASLARDVGISQPTAERWLSILVASNIVYLLKPYSNNITKRAVKTPEAVFFGYRACCLSYQME